MRFLMLNWRDPLNPLAGGAERVTEGYLSALRERGHDVWWFANAFPGGAPEETVRGLPVVRRGGKGRSILEARWWYRRQARFDLVIDQHHGLPWFAPWWCGTRCVAYIHEVLGPIWDVFYRWPTSMIGRWQERSTHWVYRNVPFWTASAHTKALLEAMGVRRVQIIPYGVHTQVLTELEPKRIELPIRLIMVSRLAPNKRVDHGIRAVAWLRDRGVEARLTIVGSGDREGVWRQLAADLGLGDCVEFTGALSEPEKDVRLRQAHLLLHTSLREGWGLNVIEANAMGTPAVVYPVAGLVESTLHDQTGRVTDAETPEALGESILACWRVPGDYERYRRAAWERAATFHWSQVLPRACDWLEAMARGEG
ncbi:MAG TPA: glycosyltransferase family 4 protein [Verrucomicrobiota bacterium]|nr:glycosyltransferase family 4 protein [Verrucomicrobiota bacterium]HNU52576.1 glycosyltransferase family 4 protein [Verrucomicrobiota bacterium]